MRILFICGSLEVGLDGVGDYCRRLAGECIRQGAPSAIVALNDRYCSSRASRKVLDSNQINSSLLIKLAGDFQDADGTQVPVLRLSDKETWRNRLAFINDFAISFSPNIISLQYVPYSFNKWGLPVGLPFFVNNFVKCISSGASNTHYFQRFYTQPRERAKTSVAVHIMFHEICVGLGRHSPIKHRIMGFSQLLIARYLIRFCNAASVHTQCTPYVQILKKSLPKITKLNLFSNIQPTERCTPRKATKFIRIAFFGSVHSGWSVEQVTCAIQDINNVTGKPCYIIAMGRGGPNSYAMWSKLRKAGIRVLDLGPLSAHQISYYLAKCDIGLSATCPDLIEKSSIAATMFGHGLSVVLTRQPIWNGKFDEQIRSANQFAIFPGQILNSTSLLKRSTQDNSLNHNKNFAGRPTKRMHSIMTPRKLRIAIIASGLGIVNRGFESSALIWARAIQKTNQAEVLLLSGGYHQESSRLFCISQTSIVASGLRQIGLIHDGVRLQQISIAPFVKLQLTRFQPDFIWLQEGSLAEILQPWIRSKLQGSKIVFCDGAPLGASYCSQFDLVINLTPKAHDELIKSGFPLERACFIPHPVEIARSAYQSNWRSINGFTPTDNIVLSVAAWNSHHKRIDYVIKEIASARKVNKRIKLLLCGSPTNETDDLKRLASNLLGKAVVWKTLPYEEMQECYIASDIFVLASKNEGLGAVLIEAAIAGLPILCNNFSSAHYILGNDYAGILDLLVEGNLAKAILNDSWIMSLPDLSQSTKRRFAMDQLADQLLNFLSFTYRSYCPL